MSTYQPLSSQLMQVSYLWMVICWIEKLSCSSAGLENRDLDFVCTFVLTTFDITSTILWLLPRISSAFNRAMAFKSTCGGWFIMPVLLKHSTGDCLPIVILHYPPRMPVGLLTTTSASRISLFVGTPPPIPTIKPSEWRKCGSHVAATVAAETVHTLLMAACDNNIVT